MSERTIGIQIFYEELANREISICETGTHKDEKNGDFELTDNLGRTVTCNYKEISDLYGHFTFFHFEPKEAIDKIINIITTELKSKKK